MNSSQNYDTTTAQVDNETIQSAISQRLCSNLEKQKQKVLDDLNVEKSWVKVSDGLSVKLRKNTPIMESTFKLT